MEIPISTDKELKYFLSMYKNYCSILLEFQINCILKMENFI